MPAKTCLAGILFGGDEANTTLPALIKHQLKWFLDNFYLEEHRKSAVFLFSVALIKLIIDKPEVYRIVEFSAY